MGNAYMARLRAAAALTATSMRAALVDPVSALMHPDPGVVRRGLVRT
jgi:hypothetical protein